ncbi:sulfate ABC transporter permease subunit CysT [soil metagenome]
MAGGRHILPGFRMTLGYTVFYLSIIVLIPFSGLLLKTFTGGWENFWRVVTEPKVVASYYVSFGISFVAALVNGVFGVIAAWVLARYQFPGRRILDAMVDLPFALPTAVAGIALSSIYAPNGMIGEWFTYQGVIGQYFSPDTSLGHWLTAQPYIQDFFGPKGLKIAYSQIGILIALTFIGLPFVVRTVQPVIQDLSADVEEAAATLGANRWQTFRKVIFPALFPSILTGVALAYGRAVGEYGSVIFIAGNIPFKTQITPVLIVNKLEEGHGYTGAAALAFVMLLGSFIILLATNGLQAWDQRRRGLI